MAKMQIELERKEKMLEVYMKGSETNSNLLEEIT